MIVAIEGMDGVGKTTVARSIEKDLSFKYVKEPLKELFGIDSDKYLDITEKIFSSGDERLISWFVGLGDSYALRKYANEDIVMDRHVLLNYFWNGNEKTEKIFEVFVEMFGRPELTILLLASPEVRMKRIAERNPNDPDLKKDILKEYGYDKMIDFLNKYNFNYIVINTEKLTPEETIEECKRVVNELKKENSQVLTLK